jgi:hypothetical protein
MWNAGNPAQAARTGRPLAFQSAGDYGFGNAPSVDPQARQCGTANEDLTVGKAFRVRENLRVRFTADAFNIFNRHTWQTGDSQNITSANFGEITPYQIAGPRQMQVSLRIEW